MDAYLAVVSLRVVREYDSRDIPDDLIRQVLEAGRATGSSRNTQQWSFYVARGPLLDSLAQTVYAPENVRHCRFAVGIGSAARSDFDAGRAAQNMALAAWSLGIGSCPNGMSDREAAQALLRTSEGESLCTILSFGYPLHRWTPRADDTDGILRRIGRKPLDQIVHWPE